MVYNRPYKKLLLKKMCYCFIIIGNGNKNAS